MGRLKHIAIPFLLVMVASGGLLFGQTQTGTITGKIVDETDAVLPGVTVTITSEALIQTRTMVTTETGSYQFVNLPPGSYNIEYELPGFATLRREEIRISVGFVARINVIMSVAGVAETVTVTGESPTVDVKTILKTTRFDSTLLDNLPSSRDPWIMSSMVPGAQPSNFNIGGTASFQQYGVSVHGTGAGASMNIDGLNVNWTGGSAMIYYGFSMFEEMSFQTNAQSAEVESPGMNWNMVTGSGGNSVHGDAIFLFMNESMSSDNIDQELIDAGAKFGNPITLSTDVNAKIGGPIIKDKIWFFGVARYWRMDRRMLAAPGTDKFIDDNSLRNFFVKGTWQINPSNNFTYSWNRNLKYRYHRMQSDSWFTENESTFLQDQIGNNTQGKFTSVLSDKAFFDARAGVMFGTWPMRWQSNVDPDTIGKRDEGTNTYWDAPRDRFLNPNYRISMVTSLSYFADDVMGGTHSLKTGLQFGRCWSRYEERNNKYAMSQTYEYGVPIEVTLYNTPTDRDAMWNSYGLYVQDDFTIKERLTLNLGVRFDRYHGWVPAHSSPAGMFFPERSTEKIPDVPLWNDIAPRLGFSLDVTGDGKTAIKGNYSRYYGRLSHGLIMGLDPLGVGNDTRTWTDTNGDDFAQLDEMGPSTGWRLPASRTQDPDLGNYYEDEITLGVEREVAPDFNVGVTYYHKKNRDDYSTQNVAVTPDDYTPVTITNTLAGEPITVYEISEEKRAAYQAVYRNNDNDWADYNGVEVTWTKRYSKGWQMMGGLTIQKRWGGMGGDPGNPNNLIFPEGIIGSESTYVFKVLGSYQLPYDIMFSGNFNHMKGYPLSLRLYVYGLNQGRFYVRPEERGESRMDNVTLLDFRATKIFNVSDYKFEVMVDLYNALNDNTPTSQNTTVGPSLFEPRNIMTPRIIRLGVRFTF